MLGDCQLLQGVVCGDTVLKSQSLVSTQLHGISSKADAGTEQTWVPHPSELLAILTPITEARCHLEQASIGSLCFVSCLWYHLFQLFNTAPSPCAALLGLPGCQCPALYHHVEQLNGALGHHGKQWALNASSATTCSCSLRGHRALAVQGRCWGTPAARAALGSAAGHSHGHVGLQGVPGTAGGTNAACRPSRGLCHRLPHLQLCVATQKSRAGGPGEGSQPMPVCLGRSLPTAWTSRM